LQPPTRWEAFVATTLLHRPEPTKERVEATIIDWTEKTNKFVPFLIASGTKNPHFFLRKRTGFVHQRLKALKK